jgi:hypothetical protein
MPARRSLVGVLLLVTCVLGQAGCLAVVGGAALGGTAYAYHNGKATAWFPSDFADSWHAVKEALNDLALPIKAEQRHRLAGTIESATHTGTKITITLEEKPPKVGLSEHQTELTVRVGVFGDSEVSQRLLEQIRQRLAARQTLPPPPMPATPAPGSPPPVPPQERAGTP